MWFRLSGFKDFSHSPAVCVDFLRRLEVLVGEGFEDRREEVHMLP